MIAAGEGSAPSTPLAMTNAAVADTCGAAIDVPTYGATPKRLGTEVGDLDLATPRDRNGTFEPRLVEKGQRRVGGLSDMIISLYSGGMTVRDIQSHLERTLGTELSHETIANITDAVVRFP